MSHVLPELIWVQRSAEDRTSLAGKELELLTKRLGIAGLVSRTRSNVFAN